MNIKEIKAALVLLQSRLTIPAKLSVSLPPHIDQYIISIDAAILLIGTPDVQHPIVLHFTKGISPKDASLRYLEEVAIMLEDCIKEEFDKAAANKELTTAEWMMDGENLGGYKFTFDSIKWMETDK